MANFTSELFKEILRNIYNYYSDNYDEWRFGKLSWRQKCTVYSKKTLIAWFGKLGLYFIENAYQESLLSLNQIEAHFNGLEKTWNLLEDVGSKRLLAQVFAYRILGGRRYKLPLNDGSYWKKLKAISHLGKSNDFINIEFMNWQLKKIDLKELGYDMRMFYTPSGVLTKFVIKQYNYQGKDKMIKAEAGDYVVDAGGCYGDMALRFVYDVGDRGKVFSFEFIPSNLKIMKKNIELNPRLKSRIEVAENPLWSASGQLLFYYDNGPASKVSSEKESDIYSETKTISLDDYVERKKIPRIDFIKMDIEGAELDALRGAENTIKKFRPKMAISVYHKLEDFYQIPEFLNSLGLGYKFYLGHYTIHAEETILYAAA